MPRHPDAIPILVELTAHRWPTPHPPDRRPSPMPFRPRAHRLAFPSYHRPSRIRPHRQPMSTQVSLNRRSHLARFCPRVSHPLAPTSPHDPAPLTLGLAVPSDSYRQTISRPPSPPRQPFPVPVVTHRLSPTILPIANHLEFGHPSTTGHDKSRLGVPRLSPPTGLARHNQPGTPLSSTTFQRYPDRSRTTVHTYALSLSPELTSLSRASSRSRRRTCPLRSSPTGQLHSRRTSSRLSSHPRRLWPGHPDPSRTTWRLPDSAFICTPLLSLTGHPSPPRFRPL